MRGFGVSSAVCEAHRIFVHHHIHAAHETAPVLSRVRVEEQQVRIDDGRVVKVDGDGLQVRGAVFEVRGPQRREAQPLRHLDVSGRGGAAGGGVSCNC